jgi:hypothetical protein
MAEDEHDLAEEGSLAAMAASYHLVRRAQASSLGWA